MTDSTRRRIIGLVALALFAGAGAFQIWPPETAMQQEFYAACLRMGLLMGLWWLAYPQTVRLPVWIWVVIPASILAVALRPKLLVWVIPIVIVLAILRPRAKKNH